MGKYKLFIKASAVSEIEAIPRKTERQQIMAKIRSLEDDPRPADSMKLSGYERYRIRHGSYRIVYGIEDGELTVYVVTVGRCNEISKKL